MAKVAATFAPTGMNLYGTGNDPSAVTDPLKAHTDLCSTLTDRYPSLQQPLGCCRPASPTRQSLRSAALDLSRTRWNLWRLQRILTKPRTTFAWAIPADPTFDLDQTLDPRVTTGRSTGSTLGPVPS